MDPAAALDGFGAKAIELELVYPILSGRKRFGTQQERRLDEMGLDFAIGHSGTSVPQKLRIWQTHWRKPVADSEQLFPPLPSFTLAALQLASSSIPKHSTNNRSRRNVHRVDLRQLVILVEDSL
jgi:hypothetical protein